MLPLRLATRGSALALWQANHIAGLLRPRLAPRAVELVQVQSLGDQLQNRPLTEVGGQGLFTKEIQRAVLEGAADLAVHSLKDLPTVPTPGLVLAAVPPRGPVQDAFLSPRFSHITDLPQGATIATGSPRRRAQLLHHRPDLKIVDLRGNVDTRLRKMHAEGWDGMILALAGLERLGLTSAVNQVLDPEWMLPAVGQGALAVECRADDRDTLQVLQALDHPPTHQAVIAERAFLRQLGGGCSQPIAAWARPVDAVLRLHGAVFSTDGKHRLAATLDGTPAQAEPLGEELAKQFLAQNVLALLQAGSV